MPTCAANIRETKIAFGKKPQTDLHTKNLDADLWSLTKVNAALTVIDPQTEDNAQDIGKGDEFPTEVFPTVMNVAGTLEKYACSEFAAWCFAFGLGSVVETAAGTGFKYVCTPQDPAVDCLDLPPFTMVEKIREPPDAVVDQALIGMVVNSFTFNMESGPGRANCRFSAEMVGSGKIEAPTTSIIPALTPEHSLNAASATLKLQGIDYVATKQFISCQVVWNNNVRLDTGVYPGSGVDAHGFALRGRMEMGDRSCEVTFVARAAKGSLELQSLLTQSEVTDSQITVTGATIGAGPEKHGFVMKFPRTRMSATVNGEQDGLVTVNCSMRILKASGQPYVQFEATTTTGSVGPALEEALPESVKKAA